MIRHLLLLSGLIVSTTGLAQNLSSPAPDNAKAYIISPDNGATVPPTFTVQFGLRGMGVAPAGIDVPNTGHHHLVINSDLPAANKPMGKEVKHFGAGQTEAEISLPPGTHQLQLVLGNYLHVPHEPAVISDRITITVK